MRRLAFAALIVFGGLGGLGGLALLDARVASAHDVRGEVLFLDIGEHVIGVEVQVPVHQLELARRAPFDADRAALAAYATTYVGATARDGRPFTPTVRSLDLRRAGDGDVVDIQLDLAAPPDTTARWFELRDDLVLQRVQTDTVYVFVRRDVQSGITGDDGEHPKLAGYLHYQQRPLAIDRSAGRWTTAFGTVFRLGMRHIAAGTDHVLFLLVLLLPAPLLAAGGRWSGRRTSRETLRATLVIATAFTLGHSLTLAIGATFGAVVPPRIVEVLVAASILVSAVHAWRPLFPGRETWIAAGFGLVHGLAFASALAGFGLDRPSLVLGVLGFNLGVEAMQLIVLLVALPALILLARRAPYALLRQAGAAVAAGAATWWIIQRLG